jgi:hypothetical protein
MTVGLGQAVAFTRLPWDVPRLLAEIDRMRKLLVK